MTDKQEARREIRAVRDRVSAENLCRISQGIVQNLILELETEEYDTWLFFHPLPHEVSLLPYASQLLSLGRTVAFPRVQEDEMEFYAVRNIETDFSEGAFHVMEPVTQERIVPGSDGRTVMFVPGLVFDRVFYRLGYGKGYYDRYLKAHPGIVTIGICPDRFFMPEIPRDAHDIAMDRVCTESRLYESER